MLYVTLGATDNLQLREFDQPALAAAIDRYPLDCVQIAHRAKLTVAELAWYSTSREAIPNFETLLHICAAIEIDVAMVLPEARISASVIALTARTTDRKKLGSK